MGNPQSEAFEFDVQAQIDGLNADVEKYSIYNYITGSNEGKLIVLTKRAMRKNKFKRLDKCIKKEVGEFLYDNGNGKEVWKNVKLKQQNTSFI